MSYVKQTWITDEIITSEKLNHMEDGIEASENKCFSVGTESVTYFECQGVQAVDGGEPLFMIPTTVFPEDLVLEDDELTITVNGTEYQVERQIMEMGGISYAYYGDDVLNLVSGTYTIPFSYMTSMPGDETHVGFYVTEETTYDIIIEGKRTVVTSTDDFKAAVANTGYNPCYSVVENYNYFHGENLTTSAEGRVWRVDDFPDDLRINDDVLTITIDGETYSCEKNIYMGDGQFYGTAYYGEDPANFLYGETITIPFVYAYNPCGAGSFAEEGAVFLVLDSGEHSIDITSGSKLDSSADFKKASLEACMMIIHQRDFYCDKTADEVYAAIQNGIPCFLIKELNNGTYVMRHLIQTDNFYFHFSASLYESKPVKYGYSHQFPYLTEIQEDDSGGSAL